VCGDGRLARPAKRSEASHYRNSHKVRLALPGSQIPKTLRLKMVNSGMNVPRSRNSP
jgi:hypothetical protein